MHNTLYIFIITIIKLIIKLIIEPIMKLLETKYDLNTTIYYFSDLCKNILFKQEYDFSCYGKDDDNIITCCEDYLSKKFNETIVLNQCIPSNLNNYSTMLANYTKVVEVDSLVCNIGLAFIIPCMICLLFICFAIFNYYRQDFLKKLRCRHCNRDKHLRTHLIQTPPPNYTSQNIN